MSRIYDALKRAAEGAKQREAPTAPLPPEDGNPPVETSPPLVAEVSAPSQSRRPPEPPLLPRTVAPPPPPGAAGAPPLAAPPSPSEQLKAELADRIRMETWMRLEAATLQELRVGRLPANDGSSAQVLEAVGGVALGTALASIGIFLTFMILVWLFHIRIPELFW